MRQSLFPRRRRLQWEKRAVAFVGRGTPEMKRDTLNFLLSGGHLSMPERIGLGLWPHPPLKYADLVGEISRTLVDLGRFPLDRASVPQGRVEEGMKISRISNSSYLCLSRVHDPRDPSVVIHEGGTEFRSAEAAAAWYLRWDMHITPDAPGNLDGWKVEP